MPARQRPSLPALSSPAVIRQDLDLSWRIIGALAQRQCAVEFDVTGYHYGLTGTQRVLDYLIELAGGYPGLAGESSVTLNTSNGKCFAVPSFTVPVVSDNRDPSPESYRVKFLNNILFEIYSRL